MYSLQTFVNGTLRKSSVGIPLQLLQKFSVGEKNMLDNTNQMLYVYLTQTMKHAKKIIFNLFGLMVLNAYILYKYKTTPKSNEKCCLYETSQRGPFTEWLATKCVPQNIQEEVTTIEQGLDFENFMRKKKNFVTPKAKRDHTRCVGVQAACLTAMCVNELCDKQLCM